MTTNTSSANAEAMPEITRRGFFTAAAATATVVATAGPAISAPAAPAETVVDKLDRLAGETAAALDEWIDGFAVDGHRRPDWDAIIAPASTGRGHHFRNRRATGTSPEQRLEHARKEMIEATKAAYPEIAEWRILTPDSESCADDDGMGGMFMILGHKPRKAVRS